MKLVNTAIAAIGLAGAVAAAAQAAELPASITVSGRGQQHGSPDLAVIAFAVETTAPEASAAMEENARKSQSLSGAIKAAIGEGDRVQTSGYSLDPVYDHRAERAPDQPPAITGYVARNEVQVETGKTGEVGKLIDLAAKAGANRISGLQFTLKDQAEARARALEHATEDAKRQAATIAAALGVRLGRVLSASTTASDPMPPRPYYRAAMAMEASAPPPIEPGEVSVEATVHVTFAID